jgi:transposase
MPRRRQHSGEFKAKVVVQALKGQKTINELAQVHALHPLLITQWKEAGARGAAAGVCGSAGAGDAGSGRGEGAVVRGDWVDADGNGVAERLDRAE